MQLDGADRRLLNILQAEFPMTAEPFADIGRRLDAGADDVIRRTGRLKERGIIRQIGPVVDAGRLGYRSTLAAMRVAEAGLERAEQVIAGHPGVSHGYEREHHLNVWFTLTLPLAGDMETELGRLAVAAGAETALSLPAIKVYKIRAFFDMDEGGQTYPAARRNSAPAGPVQLSPTEKLIINELQQDLPLVPGPFAAMAEKAGTDVTRFLAACRSLQERGVIRRYSAAVNHRKAGFTANAMTCWTAPPDKIDAAGEKLASLKEVSHCYERKTSHFWRHNLFAMVHGRSREVCHEIAAEISRETGLTECVLLFSTKEFKKTRVKYLA